MPNPSSSVPLLSPSRVSHAAPTPARFGCNPLVWAAWLYHHDNLNQSQIAKIMGVSRASVVKYLRQAREQHIVVVIVQPQIVARTELSLALKERFRLDGALVVPDDGGNGDVTQRVAVAGAQMLLQELRPRDVLGVAWGRTVLALSKALPRASLPEVTVVQILGSRSSDEGFSAEQCISNIAVRLGARCVNIFAPAVLSQAGLRERLLEEPLLKEQFTRVRSCNRMLLGVCTVQRNSLIYDTGLVSAETSAKYVARGAVGVISGRFFDVQGQPVLGESDERMIGLTLEEISRVPKRLAVAGGPEKTEAILGALRGGYITDLVVDERTARVLLERSPNG